MKLMGPQFLFQQINLRFVRDGPEFAIQVFAAPRVTGVVLKARWVGDGVGVDTIPRRQCRRGYQLTQKAHERQDPLRFVAVDSCEDSETDGFATTTWSIENESRYCVMMLAMMKLTNVAGKKLGGPLRRFV